MNSLSNLERIFARYREQYPAITESVVSMAAEEFFSNVSAKEIFDHFSLNQTELDILATISFNLGNLSLFTACNQQGAKITHHSKAPALSFMLTQNQLYQHSIFEDEKSLEAYLKCKGPFLSPIPDSGESKPLWWTVSKVYSRYKNFRDTHLVEKTILRELSECHDLDEKKQKAIQLFPKLKSSFLAYCSPEFLTELSEEIELPQTCLQHLSQQLFTNQNISQDLYFKLYAQYKEKTLILWQDLERNHPDSRKGPALISLVQQNSNEDNKKAQHFNSALKSWFAPEEDKIPAISASVFQTPNEYCSFFYLMHFEKLVQLVERLPKFEKAKMNLSHPLVILGIELVAHLCASPSIDYQPRANLTSNAQNDYPFALLALVQSGVWDCYLKSPLLNESSTIALLKRIHHLDQIKGEHIERYHYHSEDLLSLNRSFCQRIEQLHPLSLKKCLACLTPDEIQSSMLFSPLYAKILKNDIKPVQKTSVTSKASPSPSRF